MKISLMKSCFVICVTAMILLTHHAEAKRMGGGMSLGRQSGTVSRNQNALPPKPIAPPVNAAPKPSPSTPPTATAPPPSRFGGMGGILGGIAAGIGLSYLLSSMGMGAGLASLFSNILMIALLAFLGMWLYRKFVSSKVATSMHPSSGMTYATSGGTFHQEINSVNHSINTNSTPVTGQTIPNQSQLPLIPEVSSSTLNEPIRAELTPNSFGDKEHFLENAKALFLQLQEASDLQNLDVLREYTSPELFSLLRKDMLTRTTAISTTQVLTLAADLIAVEEENQEYLASVRFTGSIREEVGGPVEDFTEIWNWSKPVSGLTGWILCGIQQLN